MQRPSRTWASYSSRKSFTVVNTGVAAFLRRQSRRFGSPALAGDAAHLATDALTSLGVIAGLVLIQGNSSNPAADPAATATEPGAGAKFKIL